MKKAFVVLALALLFVGMTISPLRIPTASTASQTSINTAIAKGLAYLNSTQDPDGSWNESFGYGVANTAMAVLAFENNGHYGWNASDPYHRTVQKGLNWLFYNASAGAENVSLSDWTTTCAGNPYVGGPNATQGAGWYGDGEPCYETPMVLMDIIASDTPTNVTSPGPLGVLTYKALADEIVSWIAWAQNSNATYLEEHGYGDGYWLGGWKYYQHSIISDNSVSGWPVVGLLAAQLWGINAPSWVKTELANWTTTDQDMTGTPSTNSHYGSFGYTGRDQILGGVPETAEGIAELTYCGYNNSTANITAAEGYLYRDWYAYGGWQVNIGSLYSMYGVMRAMRETIPSPTKFIVNYTGTASYEWYNGTGQYADALVGWQRADGSWINWVPWPESDEYSTALTTAMGVLILQGGLTAPVVVKYTLNVTVLSARTLKPIDGATVAIVGPQTLSVSGSTNPTGQIAFNGFWAGDYTVTTSASQYVKNVTSITLTSNYNLIVKLVPETSFLPWYTWWRFHRLVPPVPLVPPYVPSVRALSPVDFVPL
jgi:hypothetical protein